uniref:Uncharacterized protein n=1 Tax=Romanomermis culicivorax TaxID=13658 RepID=A0A915HH93_ROMCU
MKASNLGRTRLDRMNVDQYRRPNTERLIENFQPALSHVGGDGFAANFRIVVFQLDQRSEIEAAHRVQRYDGHRSDEKVIEI